MKIQEQVPKHIYFENEKGILMQQKVVYEGSQSYVGNARAMVMKQINVKKEHAGSDDINPPNTQRPRYTHILRM